MEIFHFKPGREWLEIVSRPTSEAFAEAFSDRPRLEAVVAMEPIEGADNIRSFFDATRAMYDEIAFERETHKERRVYLDWSGSYEGRPISGTTILTRDEVGAIEMIRLYHYPFDQTLAFSKDLRRRLDGVVFKAHDGRQDADPYENGEI